MLGSGDLGLGSGDLGLGFRVKAKIGDATTPNPGGLC